MQHVIAIPFEGGGSILVEVAPDGREVPFGRNPGQAVAQGVRTLQAALDPIRQVAQAFRDEFAQLTDRPDAVTVKFGVQLSMDGNAIIARLGMGANFEVNLEWRAQGPAPQSPAGVTAPAVAPA